MNEAWKSILGPTNKKLNKGSLIISGLHIDEICEAMELRPSATVNVAQSGQRTLTSFKQFQSKQSSHLLSIPSHPPQQPITGATFYSLLNLTSSIPDAVLRSNFRGTISELGSERLNQFCNIFGDLFCYILSEVTKDDPVMVLKLLLSHISHRASTASSAIEYDSILSNPAILRLVYAYNDMDEKDTEGRIRVLTFLVGGEASPFLPYKKLITLPFKSAISIHTWKTARSHAVSFGVLTNAPPGIKRVQKFNLDHITDCVHHCLDPSRSQLYCYGTKQLEAGGTGVKTTVPKVMRTSSIQDSYEVRYIYYF